MVVRDKGIVVACTLAVFAAPAVANAADWYVDASAGGGGNGSMGSPYSSLQDGLDAAMPGDTVFVLPGEYGAVSTVRDGSADARISVVATEPRQAMIMADGTGVELGHSHHTFEGLVVDCNYGAGDCVEGGTSAIELVDVEVRRSLRDCIDLRDSSDILIEGSDIHHCIATFDPNNNADAHGITGDSVFDLTVRDTRIRLVTGDAIQLSPGRDAWSGLLVESSTLSAEALDSDTNGWSAGTVIGENAFDSKVGGDLDGSGQRPTAVFRDVLAFGWRGPISNASAFNVKEEVDFRAEGVVVSGSEIAFRLRGPAQALVTNAVVYDVDVGFRMEDDLPSPRVFNSTVGDGVDRVFTEAGGDAQSPEFRNMLFLGTEVPDLASAEASNLAVDGSVFVDADGDDYHLIEGSSPMDAGVDIAEVVDDLDGVPRPTGDGYDIGAYEWTDMPPAGGTDGGSDGGSTDDGGGSDGSGDGSGGSDSGDGGSSDGDGGSGSSSGADSDGGTAGGAGLGEMGDTGCSCRSGATGRSPLWLIGLLGLLGLRRRRRRASLVGGGIASLLSLGACDDGGEPSSDPTADAGSTTVTDSSTSDDPATTGDPDPDSDGSGASTSGGSASTTGPDDGSTGVTTTGPGVDPTAHGYFDFLRARPEAVYSNGWRTLEDIQVDTANWGAGPWPPTYDAVVDAASNELESWGSLEGRDQLVPEFERIDSGDALFYWEARWDAAFPTELEAFGIETQKTFVLRQNGNMGEKRMFEIRNRYSQAEAPDISAVDFRGYGGGWDFDGTDQPLDGQIAEFIIAPESWTRYWVYCDFDALQVDVWISDETREPVQIMSKTFTDMSVGVSSVSFQFNSSQERTGGDSVFVWNRNFVLLQDLETSPQELIDAL